MSHGSTSVARTSDRLDEHPGTGRGKTIECTAHPPAQEEASAWGGDETRNDPSVSNLRPSCTNLTPTCATASGSALLAFFMATKAITYLHAEGDVEECFAARGAHKQPFPRG